ncbi:hypothetical protein [Alteriqipengyuania sp.]|uniref:hypothetical protein n=1 Tax=Alteriqipengyuania sp. TaxID=2800692 RepID=UPI003514BFDE
MLAGIVGIAMMAVAAPVPTGESVPSVALQQEPAHKPDPAFPMALIVSLAAGAILVRKILS